MQGRIRGWRAAGSLLAMCLTVAALSSWLAGCGKPAAEKNTTNATDTHAADAQSVAEPTAPVGIAGARDSALPTTDNSASSTAADVDAASRTGTAVRPALHSDPSEPAILPADLSEPPKLESEKTAPGSSTKGANVPVESPVPGLEQLPGADGLPGPTRPAILPNPLRPEESAPPGSTGRTSTVPDARHNLTAQQARAPYRVPQGANESNDSQPPLSRKAKRAAEPFDPIKENGPIFVGWPKPQAALVLSGKQTGYLEPCGCAGLDRMKGGMGRRHTLMKTLAAKGWPVVGLDVGGVAKGFGKQAELKFATAIEGMRKMGYSVVGLGAEELRLPAGLLVALGADTPTQPGVFLSANVALFGFEAKLTPRSRVIPLGGRKIGVTAVLGKHAQKQIQSTELETTDANKALAEVVPELAKQADFLVLLAYASMDEAVALAKSFPQFDVVVVAEGPAEPPDRFIEVEGVKSRFVAVGEKGMNVVVVALYDDPRQPLRYQRVPLDSRFEGSREMQMMLAAYQEQLKALGFAGLDLRPVPHPQQQTNGNFVSPKKCQSCHEESYRIWRRSRHAVAFETLVKLDPPRHYDPECISCHVVGWHPTKYFPYQGGYQSVEKTPELVAVGCDSCHGPGEGHVQAELGSDKQLQARMREAVRITKAEAADPTSPKANCHTCHDLDNSPDFNFDEYWPDVEHYEDRDDDQKK